MMGQNMPERQISASDLQQAKSSEKPLVEALEDQLGCSPAEFVTRLSETLAMPPITLEQMRAETPAFDAVPFAEAARRGCVALRASGDAGNGDLFIVLADPYDLDSQDWLESRLREPFYYRVAHRHDVATWLSQQETGLRALDGLSKEFSGENLNSPQTQEISF